MKNLLSKIDIENSDSFKYKERIRKNLRPFERDITLHIILYKGVNAALKRYENKPFNDCFNYIRLKYNKKANNILFSFILNLNLKNRDIINERYFSNKYYIDKNGILRSFSKFKRREKKYIVRSCDAEYGTNYYLGTQKISERKYNLLSMMNKNNSKDKLRKEYGLISGEEYLFKPSEYNKYKRMFEDNRKRGESLSRKNRIKKIYIFNKKNEAKDEENNQKIIKNGFDPITSFRNV